jgi:[NiFe] hydrogenase small subunit
MLSIAQEICPKAKAIIAVGNCASYGGLPAAAPNPTGAKGVKAALGRRFRVPVVNLPGCPPNPINFVGVIANYLLLGKLPSLDSQGRPQFAYSKIVHDQCPFRDGPLEDRCLEDHGCKGPRCYNNCPTIKFNNGTSWPVLANHPCIGCSQPSFWDTMTPFYQESEDD